MSPWRRLRLWLRGQRVSRVMVRPNDVIVLTCQKSLGREYASTLHAELSGIWPGHRVLVIDDGMALQVLREGDPLLDDPDVEV